MVTRVSEPTVPQLPPGRCCLPNGSGNELHRYPWSVRSRDRVDLREAVEARADASHSRNDTVGSIYWTTPDERRIAGVHRATPCDMARHIGPTGRVGGRTPTFFRRTAKIEGKSPPDHGFLRKGGVPLADRASIENLS